MKEVKTNADCVFCKSPIVEKFISEVRNPKFVGRQESYDVSCGFHCKKCGLKYELLPLKSGK